MKGIIREVFENVFKKKNDDTANLTYEKNL